MNSLRALHLLAGIFLPLLLPSCVTSLSTALPTEKERRAEMIKNDLEHYGYIETKEYVASMPAGVPIPLHNRAQPGKNGTVTFTRPLLPRGKYHVFANSGGSRYHDGDPLEDSIKQIGEWDGSRGVNVYTAVVAAPVLGEDDRPREPRENFIHPVIWRDTIADGEGSNYVHDLIVPAGAELRSGSFDPAVQPILNLEYYLNGKPVRWLRVWAERIDRDGPHETGPKFAPPPPCRRP